MEEYLPLAKNAHNLNYLKVNTDYELGGWNVFGTAHSERGYYLHCQPVGRETKTLSDGTSYTTETFCLSLGGYKFLLKEVGRKSAKAAEEAEKIAEQMKADCIRKTLDALHLKLAENAA